MTASKDNRLLQIAKSLTFRVSVIMTLLTILAFFLIASTIMSLHTTSVERRFTALLEAHLFNLIGAVSTTSSGILTGNPNLGDSRYAQPDSGWYWEVLQPNGNSRPIKSLSMTGDIVAPPQAQVPFDRNFQRTYFTGDGQSRTLQVIEREFVLDQSNTIARFRVIGNYTELTDEIAAFRTQLFSSLALLCFALILINIVATYFGLKPLERARTSLAAIRTGDAENLAGSFPYEIDPLVQEINALIDSNRSIIDRARTQVGNLAHSLKTPLAVMVNEAGQMTAPQGELIQEQAQHMQVQIQHYLQRARIAAQQNAAIATTDVNETVKNIVRVLQKINGHLRIDFNPAGESVMFAGEKGDLEEIIGNLMENATKWADELIEVQTLRSENKTVRVVISDDGPGIPEDLRRQVLDRGKRLDESKPGTGLGLSIVSDYVSEYGGELDLSTSSNGGVRAAITLPSA